MNLVTVIEEYVAHHNTGSRLFFSGSRALAASCENVIRVNGLLSTKQNEMPGSSDPTIVRSSYDKPDGSKLMRWDVGCNSITHTHISTAVG